MTLQEQLRAKREEAARALKAATDIRDSLTEHNGDWPAEKQSAFDKAMADFGSTNTEAEKLSARATQMDELDRRNEEYNKPAKEFVHRQPENKGDRVKVVGEAHKKAFVTYLRTGNLEAAERELMEANAGLARQEIWALLGTQGDIGGFLVPPDFRNEVLKAEMGVAVFRQAGAKVVPTGSSRLVYPTITGDGNMYTSGVSGAWKPEGYLPDGNTPPVQNKPNTGQEIIPVHSWQPDAFVVSRELMADSVAPVDSIIAELAGETKGLDEDAAFTLGDGVGKPEGILSAGISSVNTGDGTKVTYDGLLALLTGLPTQYRQRGSFLMNSATLAKVLALQTTAGFLIFPPNGLSQTPAGTPNGAFGTMLNRPLFLSEWMPDVAANATPIAFGDFSRYIIAEREDLRIQRLLERFAPNIGFLMTARLGGQLTRTNAFRLQKVSA